MNFKKQILFFACLLVAELIMAQDGASIRASVNKQTILIGEPILLTIEANGSPESLKQLINLDSIDHFEMLEKPVIDSAGGGNSLTIKGIYTITSLDSGHWVIPSFQLYGKVKSDSIRIDVIFADFDTDQDYHDIKDILPVNPPGKKPDWWWVAAGGMLLLLLASWYWRRRKKPQPAPAPAMLVSPFEEAMKQLELLDQYKPETKQYHSGLTDIFRRYIFRKKGILSLQKTTDDLVLQLKGLELDKGQFDRLAQALRLSDFVKFAKYLPAAEDDANCFREIKYAIMTIEKTDDKTPL